MAHILSKGVEPKLGQVYLYGSKKLICVEDTESTEITCVGCFFYDTKRFPTSDKCQNIKCSDEERSDGNWIIMKELIK
jgi:hypothetical protein